MDVGRSSIAHAPKDRLDWLVRHAGVAPTSACWVALSNRYRMNDTTALLKWLSDQGCPPDPFVAEHLDINRPHAIQIIEHVHSSISKSATLCPGGA